MFYPLVETRKIKHAQDLLLKRIKESFSERKGPFTIGFQGGNFTVDSFHANDHIWFVHNFFDKEEVKIPRYWNAFGLADSINIDSSNGIFVEINIATASAPGNIGGLFAVNHNDNHIWLLHRGLLGGGQKGVGKSAFLNWHKENHVMVKSNESAKDKNEVIAVADLSSSEFQKQLTKFVLSVGEFKRNNKNDEIASLSEEELLKAIGKKSKSKKKKIIETTAFERDPHVIEFVKRRAKGICQLCEKNAPFSDNVGRPYLECHHVIWLSEGGEDSINNAVALCPNCHRKMHILQEPKDVKLLKSKIAAQPIV